MARTVEQALRAAGLKRRTERLLVENRDFARAVVQMIMLLSATLETKLNAYHGKGDFSQLPEVVSEVWCRHGRVLDYIVAKSLGMTPTAFSNVLKRRPEIRLQYDSIRRALASQPSG